jgi:hypothetical protein
MVYIYGLVKTAVSEVDQKIQKMKNAVADKFHVKLCF